MLTNVFFGISRRDRRWVQLSESFIWHLYVKRKFPWSLPRYLQFSTFHPFASSPLILVYVSTFFLVFKKCIDSGNVVRKLKRSHCRRPFDTSTNISSEDLRKFLPVKIATVTFCTCFSVHKNKKKAKWHKQVRNRISSIYKYFYYIYIKIFS